MHIRSLQTFVRIAELGSFAAVAAEMNTTLSTVSMQMKALEETLDITLFDRSFRPPKLTPLARSILVHARAITQAEAQLLQSCNPAGELAGTYKIGFIATASVRLLPVFLSNAAKHAPKAGFELETALSEALELRVASGLLDAAVVTASSEPQPGLQYEVLQREMLVFAAPAGSSANSPEELGRELPFVQFNPKSGIGKLIENRMLDMPGYDARKTIILDSVEAIMGCVNAGLGFTLLSEPDIRRYAGQHVKIISHDDESLNRDLVLATSNNGSIANDLEQLIPLFADNP